MEEDNRIFNLNASTVDSSAMHKMTKEDFINEIKPKIQEILNRAFPGNKAKQTIKVHNDRISFAAPCCGDSSHNNYKKRGNIILEGKFRNLYKCFNCGACMSVHNFLKQYGQDMSLNMIDYVTASKNEFEIYRQNDRSNTISNLYDTELIDSLAVDREYFRSLLNLTECSYPCNGKNYLVNRKQFNFTKFMYSIQANKLFILNLTPSGKILGLQVRSFDKNTQAKYKTYSLQKIHDIILKDGVNVPDNINELSMIFNILLVDYNRYVTVTEGPMDSFLIKNSIALCGAGKHIEFPFMVRYMFDDDKPGREHSIEMINNGYQVFLWDKFKRDLNITSNKKLDMNDVVIMCSNNGSNIPELDEYFSDNQFDLINI